MKTIQMPFLAAAAALSLAVPQAPAATPAVSGATMTQPNAAGRDVTIAYNLANAPAVVTLDIQTNSVVDGVETWTSIGGGHIQTFSAESDVWRKVEGNGPHSIVWKAGIDWPGCKKTPAARAVVTAWALDDTPDYMVVDIAPAAAAGSQRYYTSTNFIPRGLSGDDAYRTSKIVMRRIHAKNVPWTMGSILETNRQTDREIPHAAMLTNDYYIGVFPVTQAQWANAAGYNRSKYEGADRGLHPAEMLSYNEIRCANGDKDGDIAAEGGNWPDPPQAGSFLDILNGRTGLEFDLPTEGEWEFACRAGGLAGDGCWNTGAPRLVTGDAEDANMPGANKYNGYASGTAPVGLFQPNAWGLYDMHGNVWEWCLDWYKADRSAFAGRMCNNSGSGLRAQRGGCAATSIYNNRTASRAGVNPAKRVKWYGFRLACRAGLK